MFSFSKKSLPTGLFLLLFLTFFNSCYYDKEDLLYGTSNCDTSNVSFNDHILPLVKSSCATAECHAPGGSGNGLFENYDQIRVKVDNNSFYQRVVVDRDMPPGGGLNECQIQLIEQWINLGAPNN